MEYILLTTLSGSCITLFYLIFMIGFRECHFEKLRYLFLKICVLFYLVPLLFLKQLYQALLAYFPAIPKSLEPAGEGLIYTWSDRATLVTGDGTGYYYNEILRIQMLLIGIWVGGAVICFLYHVIRSWSYRKELIGQSFVETGESEGLFQGLCGEYHIRRKVTLRICRQENACFTMGVFRPVIFCSKAESPLETELLLRHELVHIRRWDMLWQFLALIALGLHWFNPFAWFLHGQIKKVREYVCDEEVLAGRDEEEQKVYMTMLVLRARKEKRHTMQIAFSKKGKRSKQEKRMEERLNNIMKLGKENKPWVKAAAVAVIVGMTFVNSLTAFAYPDVQAVRLIEDSKNYEDRLNGYLEGDMVFAPDELGDPNYDMEKVYYDVQFIDEEGNVYPVEDISSHEACDHTFVSGTVGEHLRNSTGGCTYTIFKAQRCTKCGGMLIGDMISQTTYVVCPH
ncbi:MAG: M56 family metallopeptidase [Acetatifactor sp.]|nr:M56 family metallopeptidase [Acetatifactor sp.]